MPNFVSLPCPECEGVGKQVNYFDIPKRPNLFGTVLVSIREWEQENSVQRTHDGREYCDYECSVCNGSRQVTLLLPPGVKGEDLIVFNRRYALVQNHARNA